MYIIIGICFAVINFVVCTFLFCLFIYAEKRDNKLARFIDKYLDLTDDQECIFVINYLIGTLIYPFVWPLPFILLGLYMAYKYIFVKALDKVNDLLEEKE